MRPKPEKPNLLARGGGYTDDPRQALGKARAVAGQFGEAEPEAVDPETQRELTAQAHLRDADRRSQDVIDSQAKVIANKIARLQREGAKCGIDLGPALREFLSDARSQIAQAKKAA